MFKPGKSKVPQTSLLTFFPQKDGGKRANEDVSPALPRPAKRVKLSQVLIESFKRGATSMDIVTDDDFQERLRTTMDNKRKAPSLKKRLKERDAIDQEKKRTAKQILKTRAAFTQSLEHREVKKRQRKIETVLEEYAGEEEALLHDLVSDSYKIVLSTGSVSAQVMFIGSFPNWQETMDGNAFESKQHQTILTLLAKYNIDTTHDDCYYTHLVKIRPRNRWPSYREVEENLPFLLREIKIIRPKIIVCFDAIAASLALRGFILDPSLRGKYNEEADDYSILTEKSLNTIHDQGRHISAIRFKKFRLVCRLHILPDLSRISFKQGRQWDEEIALLRDALFLQPIEFVETQELLLKYYATRGVSTLDDAVSRFGGGSYFSRPTDTFITRANLHHRILKNNYIDDHLPGNDRVRLAVNMIQFLEARNEFILFCGTYECYSVTLHVTDPTFEFWLRHESFDQYVRPDNSVNFRLLSKREIETEIELKLIGKLEGTWPFEDLRNEEIWEKLGVSVEYTWNRSAFLFQPVRSRFLHVTFKHYSILKSLKNVLSKIFQECEFFETKVTPHDQLFFTHNIYNYGWIGIDPHKLSEVEQRETIDDLEFTCTASALRGRNPNTGQSRSKYDEAFYPMTFAATDFEMLKHAGGGGMPTPESDAIVRICVYLSHVNPQTYAAKFERLRDPKKAHQTYNTGRTHYINATAFVVGIHGPLLSDVFKPEYLPYSPIPPETKPGVWLEEVTVPYLRSIYDWNQFVEKCVDWVSLVGTYRAEIMFRSVKLAKLIAETDLSTLPKTQKEWQKYLAPREVYTAWREKMKGIWSTWHTCRPYDVIEHPDNQPTANATPLERGSIENDWTEYHPEKWSYFFKNESEMIVAFIEYTRQANVDVFTGHNVSAFDLTYLIKRIQVLNLRWSDYWDDRSSLLVSLGRGHFTDSCANDQLHYDTVTTKKLETKANGARIFSVIEIPGRDIFDTLHYAQKGDAVANLDGYTLSQLAIRTVGDNKHDVPWSSIPSLFFNKPHKLSDYCMQDTELCERILNALNTMNYVIGTCRILGCMTLGQFYTTGVQVKIIQLLIRQLKLSGLSKLMPDINPFSTPEDRYVDEALDLAAAEYRKTFGGPAAPPQSYTGALVIDVIPGFYHKSPIPILDFAGLYPSIMDSENLGYNTIGFLAQWEKLGIEKAALYTSGELHRNPFQPGPLEPVYFLRRRRLKRAEAEALPSLDDDIPAGIAQCTHNTEDDTWTPTLEISDIVTMNRILTRARGLYKKEMEQYSSNHPRYKILNPMQQSAKVIINSTYGACGVRTGRTACPPLAETVTENGRRKIEWVQNDIEKKFDGITVGGDTDSVFPVFEKDISQLSDILKPVTRPKNIDDPEGPEVTLPFIMHVVNHINARIPYPQKINFEKAWTAAALYKKKQADLAECMPIKDPVTDVLTFENGGKPTISSKGTANKRRSTAPYAKLILKRFVKKIWKKAQVDLEGGKREAEEYVRQQVLDMRSGKYDYSQMILSRYYARTDYKSDEVPALVINKKLISRGQTPYPLGSRIPMVVIVGRPGCTFSEQVEDPDFAIEKKIPLDIEYYIDKHLRKPLERKCAVIDPSMMERMFPPALKKTVYLADTDPLNPHVRKLRHCGLCNRPSGDSLLCPKCRRKNTTSALRDKIYDAQMDTLKLLDEQKEICYACMGMDAEGDIDCVNVHCKTYPVRKNLEFDARARAATRVEFENELEAEFINN
jgi:uracil-DNA glycosylase family 4